MAIGLSVKDNADRLVAALEAKGRRMSDVLRYAINDTVDDMVKGQRIEMRRVFNTPRPYTLNALFPKYASRRYSITQAGIAFREFGVKGTPAYKYLMPNIKGGPRNRKRSEKALTAIGTMNGGLWTSQGVNFQRDGTGDITGGQYTRMLAELGANTIGMTGPKGQRKAREKGKNRFFAMPERGGKRGDGRPQAIAERRGSDIVIMLVTHDSPGYKPIYDFYGLASRQVKYSLPKHFNRIFNRMMGGGGAGAVIPMSQAA